MKLNWKKILNWDIDCVGGPATLYGKDGRVRGYKVIVNYVHHGSDEMFFDVNSEHLYTQYKGPEDAAKQVYREYVSRMIRQKARMKNKELANQR